MKSFRLPAGWLPLGKCSGILPSAPSSAPAHAPRSGGVAIDAHLSPVILASLQTAHCATAGEGLAIPQPSSTCGQPPACITPADQVCCILSIEGGVKRGPADGRSTTGQAASRIGSATHCSPAVEGLGYEPQTPNPEPHTLQPPLSSRALMHAPK